MAAPLTITSHPACATHDTGADHPETARRLEVIAAAIRGDAALRSAVSFATAAPAGEEDLARVHTASYLARLRAVCADAAARRALAWLDDDTPVSAGSWAAALASAGCAIAAAEAVARGDAPAAFALSRPPGHHAGAGRGGGFCLLNNVAIAVRALQARGLAERALVLDLDVHHGDGTQEIFYEDPSVSFVSVHLDAHYPWTGSADERGRGRGVGTTRNVPLAAGTGALEYHRRLCEALDGALATFAPDLVVLSAGFDALAGDPEGGLALSPPDFHRIGAALLERLPEAASRRTVAVLEGGYGLPAVGNAATQLLRALARLPTR
jgi:acetoin utilization deacetylase AcuC-like enzyme